MVLETVMLFSIAPVANDTPPQESLYHFHTAPVPNAPPTTRRLVTVFVSHNTSTGVAMDVAAIDKPGTMMSKDLDKPTQPKEVFGVTVMVPVMVLGVGFCAINDAILPVPLAAKPIAGLLFTQLYVAPATAPVKLTGVVGWPAQTVWLAMAFTTAVGLTVMLNVIGIPTQFDVPFTNEGVTVMIDRKSVV